MRAEKRGGVTPISAHDIGSFAEILLIRSLELSWAWMDKYETILP